MISLLSLMVLHLISDSELITQFQDLVIEERERLVLQLEHLAELDRRKLFLHYPSLRSYLVEEHGMEEWNAERRIRAARLLKRFPELLKEKLESGRLNLTLLELAMGCAHREKLTDSELVEILDAISGKSCRAAMREIASRFPHSAETPRDRIRPLSGELSEVRFVASSDLLEKIEEIRGLLAHSHPQLSLGELIDILATEYRDRHHPEAKAMRAEAREAKKKEQEEEMQQQPAETIHTPTAPRAQSVPSSELVRKPSQAIVNALTKKNGYQCSYTDPVTQKRCFSKHGLEIHHIREWSKGGKTELSNLLYLCMLHHARVSFLQFGESSKYSARKQE